MFSTLRIPIGHTRNYPKEHKWKTKKKQKYLAPLIDSKVSPSHRTATNNAKELERLRSRVHALEEQLFSKVNGHEEPFHDNIHSTSAIDIVCPLVEKSEYHPEKMSPLRDEILEGSYLKKNQEFISSGLSSISDAMIAQYPGDTLRKVDGEKLVKLTDSNSNLKSEQASKAIFQVNSETNSSEACNNDLQSTKTEKEFKEPSFSSQNTFEPEARLTVDQSGGIIAEISHKKKLYKILQLLNDRKLILEDELILLKKMVESEYGDVIKVLLELEKDINSEVAKIKLKKLLDEGSPSKYRVNAPTIEFPSHPSAHYPLQKIGANLSQLIDQPHGTEVVVLVSSGAYNPVHMLHIRAFYLAKQHVEDNTKFPVVGGIISPSHDTYVRNKNRRTPKQMISAPHRLGMLEVATASSTWLEVDKWEITRRRVLDYLSVLKHVRELCGQTFSSFKFRLLYVCGPKTILKMNPKTMKREGFGCVVICRPMEMDMIVKNLGNKWNKVALVVEDMAVLPCELEAATSFLVRKQLIHGNIPVGMVGRNVSAYLEKNRIGLKLSGREVWTREDKAWRPCDLPFVEYDHEESPSTCNEDFFRFEHKLTDMLNIESNKTQED